MLGMDGREDGVNDRPDDGENDLFIEGVEKRGPLPPWTPDGAKERFCDGVVIRGPAPPWIPDGEVILGIAPR
jgi:hypothetical protein